MYKPCLMLVKEKETHSISTVSILLKVIAVEEVDSGRVFLSLITTIR